MSSQIPPGTDDDEPTTAGRALADLRLMANTTSRPWILVIGGTSSVGKLFPIRAEMVIGRAEDADLVLEERGVSRRHAKLSLLGGAVRISDLDSSNAVFVSGTRVRSVALRDGERIRLGDAVLTLVHLDDAFESLKKNLLESVAQVERIQKEHQSDEGDRR